MMRSSGTPCSMSTCTAFMADPPVAAIDIMDILVNRRVCGVAYAPSIGSSNNTYRFAIS